MLLHFAREKLENPKSHGESKIQNPMMPRIQCAAIGVFYAEREGVSTDRRVNGRKNGISVRTDALAACVHHLYAIHEGRGR